MKPAQPNGYAALLWRQGLRALMEAEEAGTAPDVWAHVGGQRIARGTPEEGGTLRFQFDRGDSVYRVLVSNQRLRAVVTVDRATSRILGVRFLGG